jgi:hypothetical protein
MYPVTQGEEKEKVREKKKKKKKGGKAISTGAAPTRQMLHDRRWLVTEALAHVWSDAIFQWTWCAQGSGSVSCVSARDRRIKPAAVN